MGKKPVTWIILLLVTAFGIFIIYPIVSLFIPRHGEVGHISELQNTFREAGAEIEATFTNSLIQRFPFDGPITWRLTFMKDPFLSLHGRVDTNALRAFVSTNSGTQFFWSGTDTAGHDWAADEWPTKEEYPSVNWTRMGFRTSDTNQFTAVIEGTFDMVSRFIF